MWEIRKRHHRGVVILPIYGTVPFQSTRCRNPRTGTFLELPQIWDTHRLRAFDGEVRLSRFGRKRRLTAPLSFLVELPKVFDEKTEFLTPEDNARLSAVLDSWPDLHQAGVVRLSRLTELRRGDAFNLEWKDINFSAGVIHIREPKTGEPEKLPVSSEVLDLLRKHPRSSSRFVFHGPTGGRLGIRIKKDGSGDWPREIAKAAKLPEDFRPFYGLRRTFASTLAENGTNLYTIQKFLMQKSPQMTKRHAHLRDESLRKAAETAARVLTGPQDAKAE